MRRDAAAFFGRVGGMAALARAHEWTRERSAERACACGDERRSPASWTTLEGTLAEGGATLPFALSTPCRNCEGCGTAFLLRPDEAWQLFEDVGVSAALPAGSRHVGSEEAHAARLAEVRRLSPDAAAELPDPYLGRPTPGRRRYYAPSAGHRECDECGGDGACVHCGGRAREAIAPCPSCHREGRCIVCRGTGEVPS